MSLQAYQQAAQRAESPRDTEYRLFGDVTRALIDVAQDEPPATSHSRMEALDWNRRLWTTLAADCAKPDNRLPPPVRAQIISLGLWVARHTSAVVRREAELNLLIDVNRAIMQGLTPANEAA